MKVCVIGLGEMGLPIARNLARAGHEVVGADASAERAARATDAGIRVAASAAAAAEGVEIAHLVVFSAEQVLTVADQIQGVLAPDACIVVHSTVDPQVCRDLAKRYADLGVHVVDAGMTGAAALAERGELTLLVGGSEDAVQRCRPEFAAFAASVHHLGGPGAGLMGKVVNNVLVLANAEVLRELVELGRSAGIEEDDLLGLIEAGTGRSWVSGNWARVRSTVEGGGDPHYGAMSRKDGALARKLAADCGMQVPVVDLVAARLAAIDTAD